MRRVLITLFAAGGPLITAAGAVSAPPPALIPAAPATAEQARFFETSVRPLLLEQCGSCHGADRQSGGLRVDTRAAVLKGGARGPLVTPGKAETSLLLRAVRHAEGVPQMPPGRKLSDAQIAALEQWVRSGAPWPEQAAATGDRRTHWSFQPIQRPPVPQIRTRPGGTRSAIRNPIDAFILAKLKTKGLSPAPPADRRTLLRRATFDLIGLPPTPEEIDAFANDRSPDAWEKVVERLLASPHYGERWGRHWLDIARYADSNGMDENVHYGNAWRYRDYVVRSFNEDKPFDRFIVEQLAGDLLWEERKQRLQPQVASSGPVSLPKEAAASRNEYLIATGFLSIGPKLISEVDSQKVEMDLVDEQIETTGRAFMGMTFGCARCHDHKFDPVSTQDYYALAGFFKSTKTIQEWKKPRMWFEHSLASEEDLARKAAHEKQVVDGKAAVAALVAKETERLKAGLEAGKTLPKNPEPLFSAEAKAELKRLRDAVAALEKDPPVMPACMGVTEGKVADVPVHLRGSFLSLGEVVPRRFPAVLAGAQQPSFSEARSGRLELARWIASPENPLTSRVLVNRVWRWHFGQGLVATTDNFGLLGEKPSHPELLDYLASRFAAPQSPESKVLGPESLASRTGDSGLRAQDSGFGWSLKRLHRLIMLSDTYRMSSRFDPKAAAVDPENRLRWRADVRRLEAESIRDAILAVSGTLDRQLGGTLIPLKNREYFFDHTSKDRTSYDSRRRSLYLPVVRNHLYDGFQLFDFGDASVPEGNRPTTTVAPQALFMMNSNLVLDAAAALAADLGKRADLDRDGRLRLLYLKAYSRLPRPEEVARARGLLDRLTAEAKGEQDPDAQCWTWLCQVVLASNEFVYVR